MSKRKIIPCLDMKDGLVVKGVNFEGLKEVGSPEEYARKYEAQGADELVILDIAATNENRKTRLDIVKQVVDAVDIPVTVGGGIHSVQDMKELLDAGAAKISINSAAIKNPVLIRECADAFGSEKLVLAVDGRKRADNTGWDTYINGGTLNTGKDLIEWVEEAKDLGAGSILVTSMDGDGTKSGYDVELCKACKDATGLEVIASGGCGSLEDFAEVFKKDAADGALAASMFHFDIVTVKEVKEYLKEQGLM